MIKLRTHSKAFEAENKIYALQNIRLPVPVAVSALLYFLLTCIVVFMLSKIFPIITDIPIIKEPVIRFGALPYFVTTFMRKKKFDGKPPHIFLKDYIAFIFKKNNNLEFFRVPERQSKDVIKLKWNCMHRNT